MVRHAPQRVLLIGDTARTVQSALTQALPSAEVTSVESIFDGIGELANNSYAAVMVAAEPLERRPEPAVRVLREMSRTGRLILFGDPTLELLSRKMLKYGCDDYIVSPADVADIRHIFDTTTRSSSAVPTPGPGEDDRGGLSSHAPEPAPVVTPLKELPLADIFIDALLHSPHMAPGAALKMINSRIDPMQELYYSPKAEAPGPHPLGGSTISVPVKFGNDDAGLLCFQSADPRDDTPTYRDLVAQVAQLYGKSAVIQDRHNRLQKLAISDDLTGISNARYFRHFLTKLLERAKVARFPVTLLLFDIDDFKKYNDLYGHGVGDEILKQTAQLMRRCCRGARSGRPHWRRRIRGGFLG